MIVNYNLNLVSTVCRCGDGEAGQVRRTLRGLERRGRHPRLPPPAAARPAPRRAARGGPRQQVHAGWGPLQIFFMKYFLDNNKENILAHAADVPVEHGAGRLLTSVTIL